MELKILSDEKIGDLLDLNKEYEYPCSDGSVTHTIDCRTVAKDQAKLTAKQIVEWGSELCPHGKNCKRVCALCWLSLKDMVKEYNAE